MNEAFVDAVFESTENRALAVVKLTGSKCLVFGTDFSPTTSSRLSGVPGHLRYEPIGLALRPLSITFFKNEVSRTAARVAAPVFDLYKCEGLV